MDLPDAWREVLKHRSVRDKIAIPIHCAIAPFESLPAITEMVRGKYMTWIDRATLPIMVVTGKGQVLAPIACDIYLLTPEGAKLCDDNGIVGK